MQKTADAFWKAHFPDFVGQTITERQALDTEFWHKLQSALESSDADTAYAVLLSNPAMRVETSDMYSRIKRITKWTWEDKRK